MIFIKILSASLFALFLSVISYDSFAVDKETRMTKPIKNTMTHLEAALSAVNADNMDEALKHINAARQAAKEITGSTLAPKTAHGSDAIIRARREVKKGNAEGATVALKESLDIFQAMILHRPSDTVGSQGGL